MPHATTPNLYDTIPYPGGLCYAQTHPNRIAAIASLLGMDAPPIENCRVLELGCADGGNLIPIAEDLPGSTCTGIDYTAGHIADAEHLVDLLGLTNVRFICGDILEIGPDFGQFDYIIAHGLYSWVPPHVREHILSICQHNLAPNGIAYISYNVYPGWHITEANRRMMQYHTRKISDPHQRVSQANQLMAFLSEAVPPDALHDNHFIKYQIQDARERREYYATTLNDTVILHDELSEYSQPFYFHQFAANAERHGLQFLTEAHFPDSIPDNISPEVAEQLTMMSANVIELEQYMDFVRANMFRRSLLCHQGIPIRRDLEPELERLSKLYITLRAPITSENVEADTEGALAAQHPIVKAALLHLIEIVPRSLTFDELLQVAHQRLGTGDSKPGQEAAEALAASMFYGFCSQVQLVDLLMHPPVMAVTLDEHPLAREVARYHAGRGAVMVTNFRHERTNLDLLSCYLLPHINGENDYDDLLGILAEMVADGLVEVGDEQGNPITDPERIHTTLAQALDERLPNMVRVGLLLHRSHQKPNAISN